MKSRLFLTALALSSMTTFATAQTGATSPTTPSATKQPASNTAPTTPNNQSAPSNNAAGNATNSGVAAKSTNAMPANGQAGASSMSAANQTDGLRLADTATIAVRFVTVKAADLMSSKLVGINVYNKQNETLGEIEDLVVENGKTITGLVVSVGGFLGMGESYVVLDPATVVLNQKDSTWRAFVDTSKDNLKNAPKFTYSKAKS